MTEEHPETSRCDFHLTIRPVGFVRNEITSSKSGARREDMDLEKGLKRAVQKAKRIRSLISELHMDPELEGILDGLEDFSHILVLYWAHCISPQSRKLTRVHPMGLKDLPLVGIFATRSPSRPNPVLLTAVRLLERKGNVLKVQGLDAVDGSPIIDIKPYTTSRYSSEEIKISDWMRRIVEAKGVPWPDD